MYQNSRIYRTPSRNPRPPTGFAIVALLVVVVIALAVGFLLFQRNKTGSPASDGTAEQAATFDKQTYSLTDPGSTWIIVNKKRPLDPKDYQPIDLRAPDMQVEPGDLRVNNEAATALEALAAAASGESIELILASAYRSYTEQTTIYSSMVRGYGQEEADKQSARPGHSEHQTGWAADLGAANGKCRIDACFADTPEGKWLAANAYEYGFVIRYPEGEESVTGYNYEPWHVRYVGKELAAEMHRTNTKTLEEFFGLSAAQTY